MTPEPPQAPDAAQHATPPPRPGPLLLTMGDPVGIGPEIIVRAFAAGHLAGCIVVGDPAVLRRAAATLSAAPGQAGALPMLALLDAPADMALAPPGCLPVLLPPGLPAGLQHLPWGRVDARCGAAAARCIEAAVRWLQPGIDTPVGAQRQPLPAGMVTAPVHKEALAAAGVPYPGHTEMLQALAASLAPSVASSATRNGAAPDPAPVRMMLANDELRVVLVTIHLSVRAALDALDFDAVLQTLRITHQAMAAFGVPQPRVAVAGLNPHAGEGGLFGDEEQRFIAPAVQAARAEGIDASGPWAPDTVFMRARQGAFDVVVAMLHDQGLIPVKYLGVEQGVNVTLGLPFVRTSPDHGTAFDIAGQGRADAASLMAAVRMARRLTAR